MASCKGSIKERPSELPKGADEVEIALEPDTASANDEKQDSAVPVSKIKAKDAVLHGKSSNLPESYPPTRYIEFPGDANFNGKPMTQQEDISSEVLEKVPDTLSNLAMERYRTYDHFFPKAIADNFEEGISREIIIYPKKLVFRFQLFENSAAMSPYRIEEITVRRNGDGTLYTE